MNKSRENSEIGEIYQTILEDMDSGMVFGDVSHEASLENQDTYAPGDTRYPFISGIQSRNGKISKKKKKRKNSGVGIPKNLSKIPL